LGYKLSAATKSRLKAFLWGLVACGERLNLSNLNRFLFTQCFGDIVATFGQLFTNITPETFSQHLSQMVVYTPQVFVGGKT
jgi:hypothetical protein